MPLTVSAATQALDSVQKGMSQTEGGKGSSVSSLGGKGSSVSSFAQILSNQFAHLSREGRQIETNIHEAVMGKGGLEHVAQDFAEFSAQVEAIKNIADAGISALKQIINTPI